MTSTPAITTHRELAHRAHDGLEVTLLWDPETNAVSIDVVDERNDSSFSRSVPAASALDAFNHPYVYAPAWLELAPAFAAESIVAET
jgi:hypothetical protein